MSVVSFKNVFFSYPDTPILKNVSFDIKEGEFIGIIGPNGGGKTTLLKLILGFLKPEKGTVKVFNQAAQNSVLKMGYVPQTLRFDKQFPISVLELVMEGLLSALPWYGKFSQEDKAKAMHALETVGMADFKNQSFGTLSGGQIQRALIARALVSEPKLLLLDEPTASVDSQAESYIYKILKELRNSVTILMVTHDLRTAIEQVEKVICVQNSVLELHPKEVCEHFAFGLYHPPLTAV